MSGRRGFRELLSKLLGRKHGDPETPELAPGEPELLRQVEVSWLDDLMIHVAEGARLEDVGGEDFWEHIDEMWERGDELLSAQWVRKFLEVPTCPDDTRQVLRLRLVGMFRERGNLAPILDHLEALTESPENATQAHYDLAEHYRRRGDEVLALRHFEAVLARDVDYPNVRARVERLKAARGRREPAPVGETMAGVDPASGGGGSRYLLIRELGRGASGVVYLARDAQLEREVAVKLLHPHLAAANRQAACRRFFDEARLAASLRHPSIVAILDLDEKARRIVMELCGGGTLRQVLRDRGPRPLRRALERHSQILSALDAAHARGIVHRDLKPANLMFRRDPDLPGVEAVLGDFGVAHLPDARGQTGGKRQGDTVERRDPVGTLAYMAPEQRRGKVRPESDLYASAVVFFEMLTGRYPWPRDRLLSGHREPGDFALPPALAEERPALAMALQTHLDRLGDPDPEKRPETTEAMKEARRLRDAATVACKDGDPNLAA